MASYGDVSALSSKVLADAGRQSEELKAAARARADLILRQARSLAEEKYQAIVAEAQREAERERNRILSAAQLESKRLLAEKREEFIGRVFAMAYQRLRTSLKPEDRKAALSGMIVEAATILGGGNLTVQTNAQDSKFMTPGYLARMESYLAETGVNCKLHSGSTVSIAGGVVMSQNEGRISLDNSFEARMGRLKPTLRTEVWEILARNANSGDTVSNIGERSE